MYVQDILTLYLNNILNSRELFYISICQFINFVYLFLKRSSNLPKWIITIISKRFPGPSKEKNCSFSLKLIRVLKIL